MDKRTTIGKDLYNWRDCLIQDLGGPEEVSVQKATVVDLCARQKLILDCIDSKLMAYLQKDPKIKKMPMMILKLMNLRQPLSDSLHRYLLSLGLERQKKRIPLQEQLEHWAENEETEADNTNTNQQAAVITEEQTISPDPMAMPVQVEEPVESAEEPLQQPPKQQQDDRPDWAKGHLRGEWERLQAIKKGKGKG